MYCRIFVFSTASCRRRLDRRLRQLVNAKRDEVHDRLGQFHVDFQHFPLADRHGAFAERVVIVRQRVAARVQRAGYGQRAEIGRPGRDGDRGDGHQIFGRVQRHERGRAALARRAVSGQTARLDVRVQEAAERSDAGIREHIVMRHVVVVVFVLPAHRHGALETVPLVLERCSERVLLFGVRVRGPHGGHLEVFEAVVHEKPATSVVTVQT